MVILRLLIRFPFLVLHLFIGTPLTVLCQVPPAWRFRIGGRPLAQVMSRWWASVICIIFGLKRDVRGEFPDGACLVAANHISWLDIVLLMGASPMVFVAKYEISQWPVLGFMASSGGTVFHQRGSHDSASGVAETMARRLNDGIKIAIFAEGGILPGIGVKRFHARLFAAAIDTDTAVQPVAVRFVRNGERLDDMTFLPREHFVGNFFRLLGQPSCTAQLHVLPQIEPAGRQRRELAALAESAVRGAFESDIEGG